MKVLVTGANGMLGSNIVRQLLKQNHEVCVFLHPSFQTPTLDDLNLTKYYGCILNQDSVNLAVQHVDYVIHAAARTDYWPKQNETVWKVNVEGTKNIIKACLKYAVKKLVFVGSAAALPTHGKYRYTGQKYGLTYIDSKYTATRLIQKAVKANQLNATIVMPTFMIGPYDSLPSSGQLILSQALGKLKICPCGGKNFVSAEDVAVAIVNSLTLGEPGRIYLAGNVNLKYRDFLMKVSKVTGIKSPVLEVPPYVIKMVGKLGSFYSKMTNKKPLLSYPMARISCENEYYNVSEDAKLLNMPQTNIDLAIKRCYDWMHQYGYC